jgi:hypothetical protein
LKAWIYTRTTADSCDEREGKGTGNFRINNNVKQVGNIKRSNEKVCVVMESSSVWYNIDSYYILQNSESI